MTDTVSRDTALHLYRNGEALFRQQRYDEAASELRKAGDLYRHHDALGHPFNLIHENGVSGLANTLFLLGICLRASGNIPESIKALEASLVNERFERQARFRSFRSDVERELAACYEQQVRATDSRTAASLQQDELALDLDYRFPFSLDLALVPFARLYELDPANHAGYRDFYERARKKDATLRRAESRTDDSTMRMISVGIWSVLVLVWIAYGLAVVRALLQHN
jgi:tetratricopeptide (TPR) repeat protein